MDRDKLYHLQQGLTDEFRRGILGSILAYPRTGAPADYAKAVQLLQVWEDTNVAAKQPAKETVILVRGNKSEQGRQGKGAVNVRPARTRPLCRAFAKTGRCARGDKCRWQHIQPPGGRPQLNKLPHGKRVRVASNKKFEGACYYCGMLGHKKSQCQKMREDKPDQVNAIFDFALGGPIFWGCFL